MIDIHKLGKTFHSKHGASVHAVREIDLKVAANTIFGFVGPNGAGKSTTIKMLLGFLQPSHGGASLCGVPVTQRAARQHVGYLPENPSFHPFLTAREVLETTASLRGMKKKDVGRQVERLIAKVDLKKAANRPVSGFSKGMVQRLGLANTLVGDPQLLILDEPMSGLDPLGRNLVRELLLDLHRDGKTIFFSSHILHDVEVACHEVAIMLDGAIQYQGPLEKILNADTGVYELRFRSSTDLEGLKKILVNQYDTLSPIKEELYHLTCSTEQMQGICGRLLEGGCKIVEMHQSQVSLEKFFMGLIDNQNN